MWRMILILVFLGAIGGFLARWQYLENENNRLKDQLNGANNTIHALDDLNTKTEEIHRQERTLYDEIQNSPDSDDGSVAPVLRRTIDRLRGAGA